MLTSDHIDMLLTVIDKGSFSAAARALGRTPSAISMAIANLEAGSTSCCSTAARANRRADRRDGGAAARRALDRRAAARCARMRSTCRKASRIRCGSASPPNSTARPSPAR